MKYVKPVRDWPLIPEFTAVLVVDVQQSEISQDLLSANKYYAQQLQNIMLPNLEKLVNKARQKGCEIIYTVIESMTEDGRDRGLDHKLSGIHIPKGSPLAKTLPQAMQKDDDIILPKTSSGVFNSTNLNYILHNLGIQSVIVAGLLTDQCVDMAVRDGADLGYYMICAEDACVTKSHQRHVNALEAFGGYCKVQTVDSLISSFDALE